jgi:hypothetical protein
MSVRSSVLWFLVSSVAAAAMLMVAPAADSRSSVTLSLNVNFSYAGLVTVTTPDGATVGTTAGTPTMIPAGFYSLQFLQPGCTDVPLFTLNGPGVHVEENLAGGEEISDSGDANFQPNSTYTWKADSNPTVVHTFVTSSEVLGTPPPPAGAIIGAIDPYTGKVKTSTGNDDLVGSELTAFRGKLTAGVTSAGALTLSFKGKNATTLKAGRYTFTVADKSRRNGFVLKTPKHKSLTLTSSTYVGDKTISVNLVAGHWLFATGTGKKPHTLVIHS